jgi:uncharacterized protein (UPF0254 family)
MSFQKSGSPVEIELIKPESFTAQAIVCKNCGVTIARSVSGVKGIGTDAGVGSGAIVIGAADITCQCGELNHV